MSSSKLKGGAISSCPISLKLVLSVLSATLGLCPASEGCLCSNTKDRHDRENERRGRRNGVERKRERMTGQKRGKAENRFFFFQEPWLSLSRFFRPRDCGLLGRGCHYTPTMTKHWCMEIAQRKGSLGDNGCSWPWSCPDDLSPRKPVCLLRDRVEWCSAVGGDDSTLDTNTNSWSRSLVLSSRAEMVGPEWPCVPPHTHTHTRTHTNPLGLGDLEVVVPLYKM